jgi:isopenicillin N synthase-like dioxygenase
LFEGAGPQALLLERYELALPAPDGYPTPRDWAGEFDQWPAQPADFIDAWAEYYAHMRKLASLVTSMLGKALNVPQADLAAWTDRQHSNLCVNHYIAQPDEPEEGRTRQFPHTDIGGVTLLWADDSPGGLEAEMADGSWVPIAFPPGALLVQAGDLLHLWSHGSIPANNHRVVNPPRTAGAPQTDRYSVVFFHHPDLETWVAPVIAQTGDTTMSGTTARDHVIERQRKAYA